MSGDEVAKTIMALNGTSIILISAYEIEPELIDKLKRNKVIVEFLNKPIDVLSLRETINKVIAGVS